MVSEFSYTAQLKRFFKTRGGRNLRIQGEEAQRLVYYLLRNPHLDISGHYPLPLSSLMAETGLKHDVLTNLFSYLKAINFCTFDFQKQQVFVPVVAEVFTQLFAKQGADYLIQEKA